MNLDDLKQPIILDICKDGTITFREKGKKSFNGAALPFFSVQSKERARTLQIMLCRKQYDEHPKLKGQPWYAITFDGQLESIPAVADRFRETNNMIESRTCAHSA